LDVSASYHDALAAMDDAFETNRRTFVFVERATRIYANAIDYSWPTAEARVPFRDNWILHVLGYADALLVRLSISQVPNLFAEFQSLDYTRGFRRGFGICSQNAIALVDLLGRRYDVDARVLGLDGHVVVEASLPEGRSLHDPSLGVSFAFDASNAPERITEIEPAYAALGYVELAETYDASGNVLEPYGASGYQPKVYLLERIADWLKWLLPLAACLAGVGLLRRAGSRRD
jgi:hypothetical protein